MSSQAQRRAEQKRERREAILDAAESVFGARGAANATMDEIAEAADVSKGTLYLYFKSKDDLFVALTHRPLDEVLGLLSALQEDDRLTGADLIRSMLDTHSSVIRRHRRKMRFAMASICGDFRPAPDTSALTLYADRVRQVREMYHAAIERGIADGTLRADLDPRTTAASLWASMFGATFVRMNAEHFEQLVPESERGHIESIQQHVADLLLQGISSRGES